jgi:outer membrane immunogenic protein
MRVIRSAILSSAAIFAGSAHAQDMTASFRGFRVEANGGGDRFYSQGTHKTKFGYGATIGFDGLIGDRIVLGPEGSIWRASGDSSNCAGYNTGTLCLRSYTEYGAAVRGGFLVTPSLLVFAKGGYANNKQRGTFSAPTNFYYLNGQIVRLNPSTVLSSNISGYQLGGGAEYSLGEMFYVDVQYVYSHYESRTSRSHVLGGVGVRFK